MSSPNPLEQLHRLDRSSSKFHDQVSNILCGEEYDQWVPNLQDLDSVGLVDTLDKALDGLDHASPAFQKCLHELRHVCGAKTILPTSYTISSDLLNVGPNPLTSRGHSDVYEGVLGTLRVCIKRVRVYAQDDPQQDLKAFCKEAVMWKRLTHPNVVPLLGVTITPLQLISNWMSGGDLLEHIRKHPEVDRLGLLSDVARGLGYLHSCNVIHGDLRGTNVLVDDSGRARIADFGVATIPQNLNTMGTASLQRSHTLRWTAPEVLNGEKYSKEADTLSFAMVMIEVFTVAVPFSDCSSVVAMLAIMQGTRPPRPTHQSLTEELWALMQRCWDHDPHLRPELSEALQILLTPEDPAWKRLISHTLDTHERISLVMTIFSDRNQVKMVRHLSGSNAQTFVDMLDEVLDRLAPEFRKKCLRYLYKICGRQALVPRSLMIPLCYDQTEDPACHGGFADVWKGQRHGRDVAVKVLRLYPKDNLKEIKSRFCKKVVGWRGLCHPNVLPLLGVTLTETRLVMVSKWMDNGNINDFVKTNTDVNRLDLLGDVTRGLKYMHDQGMVHGDLTGANILIDDNSRACLAGFSLLTMASDRSTISPSTSLGGTIRWMSPELLLPEGFGLKDSCPTKESDRYALGMVIYEVLSGWMPFSPCNEAVVVFKVLHGERPGKPQGVQGEWFTDDLWRILELCWKSQSDERPSLETILQCLQDAMRSSRSPSDVIGDDDDDQSDAASSDSGSSVPQTGNKVLVPLQGLSPCISDSSLRTVYSESELSTPPKAYPGGVEDRMTPPHEDKLSTPPQKVYSKVGRVGRMVRNARRIIKAIARKFPGLCQAS